MVAITVKPQRRRSEQGGAEALADLVPQLARRFTLWQGAVAKARGWAAVTGRFSLPALPCGAAALSHRPSPTAPHRR